MHITLRCAAGLPSLRGMETFPALSAALAAASRGGVQRAFRVIAFSVQQDHIHAVIEAADGDALREGARGLAIRLARAFNRAVGRRGRVFGDRYHARALRTPREVRNALVYVLHNLKKHEPIADARLGRAFDPCASSPWFDGYRGLAPLPGGPTVAPRTWLLSVGWRRHGLLSPDEVPRAS